MKRVAVLLAFVLMLFGVAAAPAGAHNLNTTAKLTLTGNDLTVQVVDVYGAAVAGAKATGAAGAPGAKNGKVVALAETEPGVYRGTLVPPGTDPYDIVVEITIFTELFRGSLRVRPGEERSETPVVMVPIDSPLQHSAWGPVLYGAAALVLVVATVVALRRQRSGVDEEG